MKKIIVSITNDITSDQRVEKICNTLFNNNFDVLLIGRKFKNSKTLKRSYKTTRLKLFFNKGFLFYAEFNIRLFFKLFFLKKDILLSNDLDTLPSNYLISLLQRKKLVFDSHELFSEVPELVVKPKVKKFWKFLENMLIPKLKNNYTVCKSISDYYKANYNVNFIVIKNLPNKILITDYIKIPVAYENKNIIIYQGALNIGRGIKLMIDTMKYLDNHIFLIVGDGDIYKELIAQSKNLSLDNKVYFLGKKTPDDLKKITPIADLGISFEEDLGLNYRYALPNKIFDYIQASVPILISDLPEMKNIVTEYKVGEILESRAPKLISQQIKSILNQDFSKELKEAKKELVWENQEEVLITFFNNLK